MPGFELIGKEEQKAVNDVFEIGNGVLYRRGFDKERNRSFQVDSFENEFSKYLGVKNSIAVTSGTASLRVALAALGVKKGDKVITQAFTFVATVEAIVESGASPVCINIGDDLNLDPEELESAIDKDTKAVIVVHMLGNPAKLDLIKQICIKKNIFLIEDTAWGCGGSFNKEKLGTIGDIGCFSFDYAKTMTTGEGGMLVTNNDIIAEKIRAWQDHGHENNPKFARWEDTRSSSGFNYRMMELQGAIGRVQLKKLDFIVDKQRNNSNYIVGNLLLNNFSARISHKESYSTCDALLINVGSFELAKSIRNKFLSEGLSTKILPEAYTWHFASTWDHIPELLFGVKHENNPKSILLSENLIKNYISIPIFVNMSKEVLDLYISIVNSYEKK